MAKEYIEREALLKNLNRFAQDNYCVTINDVIMNLPAADVAEVVHGRWEDSIDKWFGMDVYTCSKCRENYVLVEGTPKENLWHYCPNCGARMDGGEENAAD